LPDIQLTFAQGSVLLGNGIARFSESGERCIVIRVSNRPAARSEAALVARNIVASIRLIYGSKEASIETAFWIDNDANEIDLRPGAYADVLVAIPSDLTLTMYENPNRFSRDVKWPAR
jgi:hypothetical protein